MPEALLLQYFKAFIRIRSNPFISPQKQCFVALQTFSLKSFGGNFYPHFCRCVSSEKSLLFSILYARLVNGRVFFVALIFLCCQSLAWCRRNFFSSIFILSRWCLWTTSDSWRRWHSGRVLAQRFDFLANLLGNVYFANRWDLLGRWQNFLFSQPCPPHNELIVKLHVRSRAIELNMHKDLGLCFICRRFVPNGRKEGKISFCLWKLKINLLYFFMLVVRSILFSLRSSFVRIRIFQSFSSHAHAWRKYHFSSCCHAIAGSYRFHSIFTDELLQNWQKSLFQALRFSWEAFANSFAGLSYFCIFMTLQLARLW